MSDTNRNTYSPLKLILCALLGLSLAACEPAATVSSNPAPTPVQPVGDLITAAPESVGMDSERLSRITQRMQEFVDAGQLAGVVTMAARLEGPDSRIHVLLDQEKPSASSGDIVSLAERIKALQRSANGQRSTA